MFKNGDAKLCDLLFCLPTMMAYTLEPWATIIHSLLNSFCQNIGKKPQNHGKKLRKWYQEWVCCCDKSEDADLSYNGHSCESSLKPPASSWLNNEWEWLTPHACKLFLWLAHVLAWTSNQRYTDPGCVGKSYNLLALYLISCVSNPLIFMRCEEKYEYSH